MTKQGRSMALTGWRQVNSDVQGGKMLSTMTMDTNSLVWTEADSPTPSQEHLLFEREVGFLFPLLLLFMKFANICSSLFP